jgi:hypothetical protein
MLRPLPTCGSGPGHQQAITGNREGQSQLAPQAPP